MKNKKTLYLLVPLVVGLWGLIGYRVWDAVKPEEEEIDPISIVPLAASQADSVALYVPDLQYPDPFLKGVRFVSNRRSAAPIAAPASQPAPAATPQPSPVPVAPWPVQYHGYVLEAGQPSVAMLTIANQFASLSLGQDLQGYTLKTLRQDSVQISYRKESRWFRRAEQ